MDPPEIYFSLLAEFGLGLRQKAVCSVHLGSPEVVAKTNEQLPVHQGQGGSVLPLRYNQAERGTNATPDRVPWDTGIMGLLHMRASTDI
jgi:hypothetical protein